MDRDRGNTVGGAPPLALFARDSLTAPAKSSVRLEGVFGERRASFKRVAKDMLAGGRATVREHARATDPGLQLAYVVKDATAEETARARAREAFRSRRLLTEALARGEAPAGEGAYTPSGVEGRVRVRAGWPEHSGSVAEDTTGAATAARPRFGRRAGGTPPAQRPLLPLGCLCGGRTLVRVRPRRSRGRRRRRTAAERARAERTAQINSNVVVNAGE